jgi:hypothetical protein
MEHAASDHRDALIYMLKTLQHELVDIVIAQIEVMLHHTDLLAEYDKLILKMLDLSQYLLIRILCHDLFESALEYLEFVSVEVQFALPVCGLMV